jgi:enoyl-CoA hydratase/carnithine racemase
MDGFKTLIYEKKHNIAFVTLNRPQALNVYNIQMRDDLFEVLSAVKDDSEVLVAIFKGAGKKAFCAGADLSEFLTAPSPTEARKARFERDVWGLFLSIPQPLIAKFGLPEVGLGIIPAAGGTQTLPRTVGKAKALEMLLTNRWIDAEEAAQIGLVNKVVTRNKLLEVAEEMGKKMASYNPVAVRNAKQAVIRGLELSLAEGLDLEKRLALEVQLLVNETK